MPSKQRQQGQQSGKQPVRSTYSKRARSKKRGTRTPSYSSYANSILPSHFGEGSSTGFPSFEPGNNQRGGRQSADRQIAKYIQQVVLPSSQTSPDPLPSRGSVGVATRNIVQEFVMDAEHFDDDGNATFVLFPDPKFGGFCSNSTSKVIPADPGSSLILAGPLEVVEDKTQAFGFEVFDSEDNSNRTFIKSAIYKDDANKGIASIPFHCFDATSCVIQAHPISINVSSYLEIWSETAGHWNKIGETAYFHERPTSMGFTMNANATRMGFILKALAGSVVGDVGNVVDILITTGGGAQITTGTYEHLFRSFNKIVVDSGIQQGRLASMAVLCTNTTAKLEKQGQIYASRCSKDVLVRPGSMMANELLRLGSQLTYSGPAEHGAYCFWMPRDARLRDVVPLRSVHDLLHMESILVIHISGVDKNAAPSFKIRCNWIYDFYTPNQLFEKRPTPACNDVWDTVWTILERMPAGSCNPGHVEMFKSILKQGLDAAGGAVQHYDRNRPLYEGLFRLLTSVL